MYFRRRYTPGGYQINNNFGSCAWGRPPENGFNFRPCYEGWCNDEWGLHKSNGTLRFTRCNPGYSLIEGCDGDTCVDGKWTSEGHRCIRKLFKLILVSTYQTEYFIFHFKINTSRPDVYITFSKKLNIMVQVNWNKSYHGFVLNTIEIDSINNFNLLHNCSNLFVKF